METRIMYPEIISYALIAAFVLLFAWHKRKKFKKGVIVANTGYVKKTGFYKFLKFKYIIYNFLIVVICVVLIGISSVMTARLYKEDKHEETKEYYNRDIILCLDYSGSMAGIIKDIVNQYIKIVEELKGDRFGIVVFGGAPTTLLPLTDDYNYAISLLTKLNTYDKPVWEWTGMREFDCCGSSDGDGLAVSVLNFDKDDNRTKIVVMAADHGVADYIVSLREAVELAKQNNVKLYYIDGERGTISLTSDKKMVSPSDTLQEKLDAVDLINGKYYDAHNLSVSEIVKDIDNLDKTLLVEKNVETVRFDLPELLFPYLLYLIALLFVIDWRVRI